MTMNKGETAQIAIERLEAENEALRAEIGAKEGFIGDLQDQVKSFRGVVKYRDLQVSEMRLALEIAKPSTIHIYSGHVYGSDGKLVELVDGCARCRIERVLANDLKRDVPIPVCAACHGAFPGHEPRCPFGGPEEPPAPSDECTCDGGYDPNPGCPVHG